MSTRFSDEEYVDTQIVHTILASSASFTDGGLRN